MKTCWLTIPYIVLAALAVVRALLLTGLQCAQGCNNRKWYKGFLREVRDLALLCLLTLLASSWLGGLFPWVNLVMLFILAVVLLVRTAVLSVLWQICAEQFVPHRLSCWAIAAARLQPGQGCRALCWGAAFVLTGAAALAAFFHSGDIPLLFAGFLLLTLGFISLLRGVIPNKGRQKSHCA